jgi:hypothetical protein
MVDSRRTLGSFLAGSPVELGPPGRGPGGGGLREGHGGAGNPVLGGPGGGGVVVLEEVDQRTPVLHHRHTRPSGEKDHDPTVGSRPALVEGKLDRGAGVGAAGADLAAGPERGQDADRVIGTPRPAPRTINDQFVGGGLGREPEAAGHRPGGVAAGPAGLLQPTEHLLNRSRITAQGGGQAFHGDRVALGQQQLERLGQ